MRGNALSGAKGSVTKVDNLFVTTIRIEDQAKYGHVTMLQNIPTDPRARGKKIGSFFVSYFF